MNQYVTGTVIKELREKNKMTQLQLADTMIRRNAGNWRRQQKCCLDRRQSVMDNTTADGTF